MKDYLIWLNGGNCISGTAEENELIKLKEYFKKVKQGKSYSGYEFKDTEGIVYVSLSDVQAIAITECTENKDIGFSPYKYTGETEIYCGSQMDTNKCVREFAQQFRSALQKVKR